MNAAVVDFPTYWDEACQHLMKKDRVMRKLIPKFGDARLVTRGDAFVTLARSIVGQQISVKAAALTEICCPTMLRAKVTKASPRVTSLASPNLGISLRMTRSFFIRC